MSRRFMYLLLSGAIGITAIGCANTTPVMRAQSPPAQATGLVQAQAPVQPTGWSHSGYASSCQHCQGAGAGSCSQCYDPNQLINLPFHPIHRNSYTYNTPRNLMYPPSPTPAGVTQYPYYTFRGPTDFFMK